MSLSQTLFPENLYHSYIVEGNPETAVFSLRDLLEQRGEIEKQSAEVYCVVSDSFTMEDGRKVKEWHSEKNTSEGKRICIIGAKFINHDAERTLLKIIEEPQDGTHFFIVVPNSQMLLDTIISRAHVVKMDGDENTLSKKDAVKFYKSTPKDRIDLVAEIIEESKDNVGSGGLRFTAIKLINDLERIVYAQFKDNKSDKEVKFTLGELNKAREYLALPGASVKMILEHISLVL